MQTCMLFKKQFWERCFTLQWVSSEVSFWDDKLTVYQWTCSAVRFQAWAQIGWFVVQWQQLKRQQRPSVPHSPAGAGRAAHRIAAPCLLHEQRVHAVFCVSPAAHTRPLPARIAPWEFLPVPCTSRACSGTGKTGGRCSGRGRGPA